MPPGKPGQDRGATESAGQQGGTGKSARGLAHSKTWRILLRSSAARASWSAPVLRLSQNIVIEHEVLEDPATGKGWKMVWSQMSACSSVGKNQADGSA